MTTAKNKLLEQILRAKESYRKVARAQTWEEKVDAIGRMRIADQAAKEGMRKSMAMRKPMN